MQKVNLSGQIVDITDNGGATYDGKMLVCSNSVTIECGNPANVPDDFECSVVKMDNSAGSIKIVGVDGYTLNDWFHVILAMQNDNVRIIPDAGNGVWFVLGASAGAVRGAPRPHRTVIASNYANGAYNIGEADLGGVIRCYADRPAGMNLNLPTAPTIGRTSGYAGSTDLTAQKVIGSPYNVDLQCNTGTSVNGQVRVPVVTRVEDVDFDGAQWTTEAGS
jgi:hypothetical protein